MCPQLCIAWDGINVLITCYDYALHPRCPDASSGGALQPPTSQRRRFMLLIKEMPAAAVAAMACCTACTCEEHRWNGISCGHALLSRCQTLPVSCAE